MKLIIWIIGLISGILLIIYIGAIYFASQISATYPPIEEYKFQTTSSELRIAIIKTVKNQQKFEVEFKDTVGNENNGYAYYVDLRIKGQQSDYSYNFKYYDKNTIFGKKNISKIDLIGAFDLVNNTGGYKLKDSDVPALTKVFEAEFIDQLMIDNTKK